MSDSFSNKHLTLKTHIVNSRKTRLKFEYEKFDNYVKNNLKAIINDLNSRWLVSVIDTYVIQQKDLEMSTRALFITTFFNMQRLWATDLHSRGPSKVDKYGNPFDLWDGFKSFKYGEGDTLQNLLYRARIVLKSYKKSEEILLPIFEHLLEESLKPGNKSVLRNVCLLRHNSNNVKTGILKNTPFKPRDV